MLVHYKFPKNKTSVFKSSILRKVDMARKFPKRALFKYFLVKEPVSPNLTALQILKKISSGPLQSNC